jgi:short-subunit dehydrogenase
MPRPLALITGASSGIGEVFARKLALRGYDLVLVARRKDRLEQLSAEAASHGVHAVPFPADLATPAGIQDVSQRIVGEPNLDLLVNNAGYGLKGRFWETSVKDQESMQTVHIDATLQLTHAALQGMVRRNSGVIINVSSVAAYARSQGNTGYCASKGWINDFTEGLYLELRAVGSRVKVQALCPGYTYTEFHDVMGVRRDRIARWLWMDARYVVDESLKGVERGKLFVVPAWQYRMTTIVMPRLPTWLRLRIEGVSPHSRDRV